ncbi:MAG: hypothetical protein FJ135_13045 [Deltaproteobacteria bacterium]|nr:hypothetical protein [Deltaproteobacteria bacterium]
MAEQALILLQEYSDFVLKDGGPPVRHGTPADNLKFAHFRLPQDISDLFPYINRVAASASYFPKLPFIRFVLDGFWCGLHSDYGVCASFADRQEALDFMERLLNFLNELYSRRNQLEPNYQGWHPVPALHIFKLLPQTNCRACGYPTCLAFAAALSRQQTLPEHCPGFCQPILAQAVYPVMDNQGNLVSTVTLEFDPGRFNPAVGQSPADRLGIKASSGGCPITPLTSREREVLRMVAQGATNLEIAAQLELSHHTIKSHIINIFNKLGVKDRTRAAVWAVRHNLV